MPATRRAPHAGLTGQPDRRRRAQPRRKNDTGWAIDCRAASAIEIRLERAGRGTGSSDTRHNPVRIVPMKKIVMALAIVMLSGLFWSNPAEARCWWNGYRWHCTHYRPYWSGHYYPHRYYRPYYYGYGYQPYYYRPV